MTLFFDTGARAARRVRVAVDAPRESAAAAPDPRARHHADHRRLVGRLPSFRRLAPVPLLNGVMVVTCRGSGHRSGLTAAAAIAMRRRCPLVVLVAGDAATKEGKQWLRDHFPAVVIVDVRDHADRLPDLPVNRLLVGSSNELSAASPADRLSRRQRILPIGPSRNLAITFAQAAGWSRVLFLDDDVQPWRLVHPALSRLGLRRMLASWRYSPLAFRTLNDRMIDSALTRVSPTGMTQAVGWISIKCSDNSVVCRARRYLGRSQQRFISAAALLIGVSDHVPFFPTVYNEDWLFLLELMKRGREGAWDPAQPRRPSLNTVRIAGTVHQDRYDVFHPSRAPREERGDVLAEGLFGLLHSWAPRTLWSLLGRRGQRGAVITSAAQYVLEASTSRYWQSVVTWRREMIESLLTAVKVPGVRLGLASRHESEGVVRRQIGNALTAALAENRRIFLAAADEDGRSGVEKLSSYLVQYQESLEIWRRHLGALESGWVLRLLEDAGWPATGTAAQMVGTSGH